MRQLLIFLIAAATIPAWASDPGEPLDCSDWVFLEPGLSCSTVIPYPCGDVAICNRYPDGHSLDTSGSKLALEEINLGSGCGQGQNLWRIELVRVGDDGNPTLLAYIESRCATPTSADIVRANGIYFDPIHGKALVVLFNNSVAANSADEAYVGDWQRIRINGFTTMFDVLQSFEPVPDTIGFRVPVMPEGFPAADFLDTYWGDLNTAGDWSQAQPLQCGYPATAPSVGDYLTVADTLPPLTPGQGRYYVTAVHHMGQTRYGRKSSGGVLTGRDPAVLPGCGE